MPGKTYKMIELVGVDDNLEGAIKGAVSRASQTLQGLDWFEVSEIRGLIENGQVSQFQVKLQIGFRLMTEAELGE